MARLVAALSGAFALGFIFVAFVFPALEYRMLKRAIGEDSANCYMNSDDIAKCYTNVKKAPAVRQGPG